MQQDSATTVAQGMISQFSVALIINQKCDKQTKNFLLLRLQHIISISLLYASLHSVPLTIKTKKGYKKIKQSLVSSIINQKYSKQSKTSFSRLQNRISISLFMFSCLRSLFSNIWNYWWFKCCPLPSITLLPITQKGNSQS